MPDFIICVADSVPVSGGSVQSQVFRITAPDEQQAINQAVEFYQAPHGAMLFGTPAAQFTRYITTVTTTRTAAPG